MLKEEAEEKYNKLILTLDPKDLTYEARKEEVLDSINSMNKHKIGWKKRTFFDTEEKIENLLNSRTTKILVDFCTEESVSTKSFAIKKNDQVKITARILFGKMLMFAKLSLMSFIYELVETFCFPNEKVKTIFDKYLIEKV